MKTKTERKTLRRRIALLILMLTGPVYLGSLTAEQMGGASFGPLTTFSGAACCLAAAVLRFQTDASL